MNTPFGTVDLFDAHVHFFSSALFRALVSQSKELSALADPLAGAAERTGLTLPPADPSDLAAVWRGELDTHGVDRALLMASVPGDEDSVAAAVRAFPERFAGSFMLDPTRPDAVARARRAFDELGLSMVCFFPAMHRYPPADTPAVRAVIALVAERPGTAVFVHCGALSVGIRKKLGLPSPFDMRFSNPLDLHALALEFGSVQFVVPHFGAGMFREALMLADLCENVHLDTSSTNSWIRYVPGLTDLVSVFAAALAVVGPRRLLFGTDSSFFPRGWQRAVFAAQLEALLAVGVSEDEARAIFGGNLERIVRPRCRPVGGNHER